MAVDPQHRYTNEAERANSVLYDDIKLEKPFGLQKYFSVVLINVFVRYGQCMLL